MSSTTAHKDAGESRSPRGLLDPAQVSAFLGCKRSFTFHLLRTGELPSLKIGRLRRVRPEDLDAFVASRLEGHRPQT
jgi:excisionase family DNA binding protein